MNTVDRMYTLDIRLHGHSLHTGQMYTLDKMYTLDRMYTLDIL